MNKNATDIDLGLHETGGRLLAYLPADLDRQRLQLIEEIILQEIRNKMIQDLLLDVSLLTVVDSDIAAGFCRINNAAALLGATTILFGLRAGVAAAMVNTGIGLQGQLTAVSLDQALHRLEGLQDIDAEMQIEEDDSNSAEPESGEMSDPTPEPDNC